MRVKQVTEEMIQGKKSYNRPSKGKLKQIWKSEEITNKIIKKRFKKEIKEAKDG